MKDQMMALGNLISGVSLPTSIHIPSFYLEMKKSLRFPRLATNINSETCIEIGSLYIDKKEERFFHETECDFVIVYTTQNLQKMSKIDSCVAAASMPAFIFRNAFF